MTTKFSLIESLGMADIIVFFICLTLLISAGIWAARKNKSANGYFMADRRLPWWSVAGSIYGTNVSLSQIIGMLGIGYSIGFAQSHYELLAIPAILMLAHVFIPAYRKKEFFTLSAFLEERYNESARILYTIIILAVILILLVGGLYIGSRQLGLLLSGTILQPGYLEGIIIIAFVSCVLVFYGGMHAVVVAENIITVLMVVAVVVVGVCTLWQPEIGGFTGLLELDASEKGMGKMKLYLPTDHPDLPWTGVFSGLLVLHGFFWTTNQFEVQRALAARSNRDAQLGAIAAGFLKLTIPFFSISAGVAAAYLFRYSYNLKNIKPDDAFMYLLGQVVPGGYGLLGLILAGFLGAIFSSIYSMLNSFSTVVATDLYKRYLQMDATEEKMVRIGRISIFVVCIIGVLLAWISFDPNSEGNFFLVLSKNTSYLKPGVVSAFFLGVLWKRTDPKSAAVAILAAPILSLAIELMYNHWLSDFESWHSLFGTQLNFMHRVFVVFLLCVGLQVIMSLKNDKAASVRGKLNLESALQSGSIALFLLIQTFFLILIFGFDFEPGTLSWLAGISGMIFVRSIKNLQEPVQFFSGLILSIMTWSLYFFA